MTKKKTAEAAEAAPAEAQNAPETITVKESRLARLRARAEKRLEGTRAEKLLKELPVRAEKELDGLLDRVGLVRKSRIPRPLEPTSAAPSA
jgi:hypothetical protein